MSAIAAFDSSRVCLFEVHRKLLAGVDVDALVDRSRTEESTAARAPIARLETASRSLQNSIGVEAIVRRRVRAKTELRKTTQRRVSMVCDHFGDQLLRTSVSR